MQKMLFKYKIGKKYSLAQAIKITKTLPWGKYPYSRQSWGNWIHRMSSYCGRIKPAFASTLINLYSSENDTILDPFCGIGTIPVEANLLNRDSVGVDLNPYAYLISQAKMDRRPLKTYLEYLDDLELDIDENRINDVSDWVKIYYNRQTLIEILSLVPRLKKDKQDFILGCLLGISQGHRPGHLSKPSGNIIPYKPKADINNEYRPAIPILKQKVIRVCKDGINTPKIGKIYMADARNLPLKDESIDMVITSPPYFNTLDYVNVNRLRLEIMGVNETDRRALQQMLIQDYKGYLSEMKKCMLEIKRVLKNDSRCILILGDVKKGKTNINTAKEIKELIQPLGFKTNAIIDDEMPFNIAVQRKDPTKKLDRILISTLIK
jgi:DNA modification methylase